MHEDINETIKSIKKSLRLAMNGVVSTLQRRQGLNYKINFGVEISRLKEIASHYTKDKELAIALWKENIRESKLLAIYLLPEEEYSVVAESWIAEANFTEIADHLAMNILCRLPGADLLSMKWTSRKEGLFPYCGYLTLSHIMRTGGLPRKEIESELATKVMELATAEGSRPLLNCACNALGTYIGMVPDARDRILSAAGEEREAVGNLLDKLI